MRREESRRLVYSSDNLNGWTYTVFELLKPRADDPEIAGTRRSYSGGGRTRAVAAASWGATPMAICSDPILESWCGAHRPAGTLCPAVAVHPITVRIAALPVRHASLPPEGPGLNRCRLSGRIWRGVMAPAGNPPTTWSRS